MDAKHCYFQISIEREKKKRKSSKAEWKLQPRETYSTSVFVHGCKHLDLVYDLGREAAAMLKSHKLKSIYSPRGTELMSYDSDILHPLRGKPPKMRCHDD